MTREYISTTPIGERSDRVQRKIHHHLECFKRGKLTLWLKNRATWDQEVCAAMLEIMIPPPKTPLQIYITQMNELAKKYLAASIKKQFETASMFYGMWKDEKV